MPFLRAELNINYSTAAWHFSALAFGLVLAGMFGHRLMRALGLTSTVWGGAAVIGMGVLAAAMGGSVAVTVFGAWLIGAGGSCMGQALIAGLSDRFGEERAQGIAEISICSSIFASLAPLAMSAILALGLDWRTMFAVPFIVLAAMWATTRPASIRGLAVTDTETNEVGRLPGIYWCYFAIVFLSVAGEWCVGFWAPEFLEKVAQMSRPSACAGLSAFLGAMLVGRMIGRPFIGKVDTRGMLMLCATIAVTAFLLFWLGKGAIAIVTGLIVMGLAESNIYPLAMSAALASAPKQAAKATATMSLSTGSAIFLAPFTLGTLADSHGLFLSHGMVAALFALAAMVTAAVFLSARRMPRGVRF
jgi:fucose permease